MAELLDSLVFKKFEDKNTPSMTCNMCGKNGPAFDWNVAEIKVSADSDLMIVFCDDRCKSIFLDHPLSEKYLFDRVANIKRIENRKEANNG